MSFESTMEDGVLSVRLPTFVGVANREQLIDAVENQPRPFTRLRLDAGGLHDLDAAGLGALARVARIALERTGVRPILHAPTADALELIRSVRLHHAFEIVPAA